MTTSLPEEPSLVAAPDVPTASWQQPRTSAETRRFRRLVCGLGLLILLGLGLSDSLYAPFEHPQVHLLVLSGEVEPGLWPQKLPAARPTASAPFLLPALTTWTEATKLPVPRSIPGLGSGQTLDGLFQLATLNAIRPKDVAICVVQSQIATIDDAVYLVDRLDPTDPLRGRVPFQKFCDSFRSSSASIKLICLDAGQLSADPRSGMSVNDFGQLLQRTVEATGDRHLWVLVSHGSGQRSQVAAGRTPTVFLDAVVRGLQREADQNRDRRISLVELVSFVQRETTECERGASLSPETQTPWLIRGGGAWTEPELDVTLAPVAHPSSAKAAVAAPTADDPASPSHAPQTPATAAKDGAPPALRPVVSMSVPELLAEAWGLRDRLEADSSPESFGPRLRPCDYAPCHWNRMLAELLQAEAIWASQPDNFPPRIQVLLQLRTADLRTLASHGTGAGSEWLNAVRRLQPRPAGAITGRLSLALAERWQRWTDGSATEADAAERAVLDGLLNASDPKSFADWVGTKPANLHAELQFTLRLSSQTSLEWPQIRQALRVRCRAEDLACQPLAMRWFGDDMSRADQLRWYGERKLRDALRPDDVTTAQQALREAETAYEEIAAATERLEGARRIQHDSLRALPHWMALSRNRSLVVRTSLTRELTALIPELGELVVTLANGRAADCGRVEQLRRALLQRHDRLRTLLFPDALFGQLSLSESSSGELRLLGRALLETPLPTVTERHTLVTWLASSVAQNATASEDDPNVGDRIVVAQVRPDDELESLYARLLQPLQRQSAAEGTSAFLWTLGPAVTKTPAVAGVAVDAKAPVHAGDVPWIRSHVALPGALSKGLRPDAFLPRTTAATAWEHTFLLVDPRDEISPTVEGGLSALLLDEMVRVVDWQWRQAGLARSDVPESDHAILQDRIESLRSLLANSFGVSAPTRSTGGIVVKAPEAIDLSSVREQTVSIVVRNQRPEACPVRYVVDCDPALLEIETASDVCQLTSKVPQADFRMSPYDATSQPVATRRLPSGGHDELRLRIRGNRSEGSTRLVVHVVADDSTVRQDVAVNLPALPLGLVQAVPSQNPTLAAEASELRPFANRSTTYTLALRGTRGHSQPLDLTAYRVTAPSIAWPMASTMPSADVQKWLSRTTEIQEIGTLRGVTVTQGTTVPLLFPAVKADPKVSLDLSGGLLVVMNDAKSQTSTWQHLPCAPLRPAAYVEAQVDYDPERESLKIAVRPRDGLELPEEGIPVRCRIVELPDNGRAMPLRLEGAPAHSLDAMLQPHRRETSVTLPYRRPKGAAYVLIDVDDWPRAFVFAVEQDGAKAATDLAVEVLNPTRRSAVRAPVDAVPVTIAVTFPTPFVAGTDLVEVGIDRDGDRRLDGEPTVRLPADRQSGVVLQSIDAGGTWALRTSVRDWTVSLPARGLADQWGSVLARLIRGPHEVWSGGTAIAFDKTGPGLSKVAVSDDGEPTVGQPIQVTALADDRGLSGVASVSAGIDTSGLGVISAGTKMLPATAGGEGQWSVTVPTKDLPPGPSVVVIQATDFVGNPGPTKVVTIRCLTPEQAAAKLAGRRVPVLGTVQYSGEAVRDADVRLTPVPPKDADSATTAAATAKPPLTAKTNRWGQFAFDSVPPGQYDLTAKGTVRGFKYESRSPVTVAPAKEPGPIKLVFGKAEK